MKDAVRVHFYLGARGGRIDPSILERTLKTLEKDRVLERYADMIKELKAEYY